MVTTVLVGVLYGKRFDAFMNIFFQYCLGFWGTFVTVVMDMGDNCDRCHGYATTFLAVAVATVEYCSSLLWPMSEVSGRCHDYSCQLMSVQ